MAALNFRIVRFVWMFLGLFGAGSVGAAEESVPLPTTQNGYLVCSMTYFEPGSRNVYHFTKLVHRNERRQVDLVSRDVAFPSENGRADILDLSVKADFTGTGTAGAGVWDGKFQIKDSSHGEFSAELAGMEGYIELSLVRTSAGLVRQRGSTAPALYSLMVICGFQNKGWAEHVNGAMYKNGQPL